MSSSRLLLLMKPLATNSWLFSLGGTTSYCQARLYKIEFNRSKPKRGDVCRKDGNDRPRLGENGRDKLTRFDELKTNTIKRTSFSVDANRSEKRRVVKSFFFLRWKTNGITLEKKKENVLPGVASSETNT